MKAEEFHKILIENVTPKEEFDYDRPIRGQIVVHKGADTDNLYYINCDHTVTQLRLSTGESRTIMLSDLAGDDYEYGGDRIVATSGYLWFREALRHGSESGYLKQVIYSLYDSVRLSEARFLLHNTMPNRFLSYNNKVHNGMASCVKYRNSLGIEISVMTLGRLHRINNIRSKLKKKPYNWREEFSQQECLYVMITCPTTLKYDKKFDVYIKKALQDILNRLNYYKYSVAWANRSTQTTVFE